MKRIIITSFFIFSLILAKGQSSVAENDSENNTDTFDRSATMASGKATAKDIEKFSVLNPENALYGLIPGLTVLTNGGMIYDNRPTIQLRGVGTLNSAQPLVLIDGIERPLDRLAVAEIESVVVLKDAAAVAKYGIRGANGVILVNTKQGENGKMQIDVQYQHGITRPFRLPKMVDAPTYALAVNEALINDGLPARYSGSEIAMLSDGTNPDLYPNVNWLKEATRESGNTNDLNISFSGGSDNVRYFTNVNYANDFGFIKPIPSDEGYNTGLNYYKLNLRTNLDIKVTQTTRMKVNLMGSIDDYSRPNIGPGTLFQRSIAIPAAAFPVKTTNDIWGGNQIYTNQNPVASVAATGFVRGQNRILFANMNLEQNLEAFVPGLTAEAGLAYDNMADYLDIQSRTFQYESGGALFGNNSDLSFSTSLADMYMNSNVYGKFNYQQQTDMHTINAYLQYHHEQAQRRTRNNFVARQSFIGGFNYGYADKYFADLTASYSGSSYLSTGNKYRFYPAVSAAWIISDEQFLENVSGLDLLKMRASYGLSGNDLMSYELDRQYYVNGSNYFFNASNSSYSSLREGQLGTVGLEPEKAAKSNLGFDLMLSKGFNVTIDAFYEKRSNILVPGTAVISSVLGVEPSRINAGIVENKGFEIALEYAQNKGDFKYNATAYLAFARNKILERNEGYKPYPYLYTTGNAIGTYYGLEANGFFRDQDDIQNSVPQVFSAIKPGDIKYVNQNDDNVIDEYDIVPLGYSTRSPELYFSLKLNAEYKGLGVDALLQGVENFSITRTTAHLYWPLVNNGNISEWYYHGGRWTEDTKDSAVLPRLTTQNNDNNFRNNSIWLANGAYLKLRYLDIYYHLPVSASASFKGVKIFARGMNLFSIDHIKDKDPEVMNALYPSMSSYHFGCTVSF